MPINQFAGEVVSVAQANGIEPAALLAVVEVESSGVPFEPDGATPRFLFERHIFHRELRNRATSGQLQAAVNQELAFATRQPKTQYADQKNSAARMALLARARAIDPECANRACSWGMGQVMGFNAPSLGFPDATSMVESMRAGGVRAQIALMVKFIQSAGLISALNAQDWDRFALRYNGKAYKSNDYDGKLARAYARWRNNVPAAGGAVLPSPGPSMPAPAPSPGGGLSMGASGPEVVALQRALTDRHFALGEIDGDFGPLTRDALILFQRANNLTATGAADIFTLQALGLATTGVAGGASRDQATVLVIREILKTVAATSSSSSGGSAASGNLLKTVLGVLTGAGGAAGAAAGTTPLSGIDKALGGEALVGKKTAISVIGLVALNLLKLGGAGAAVATPVGPIIGIGLGLLGALGGTAKIDRAIQSISQIAAKR